MDSHVNIFSLNSVTHYSIENKENKNKYKYYVDIMIHFITFF